MGDVEQIDYMKNAINALKKYGFFESEKLTSIFLDLLNHLGSNNLDFKILGSIKSIPIAKSYKAWISLAVEANDLSVEFSSEGHMLHDYEQQFLINIDCVDFDSVMYFLDKHVVEIDHSYEKIRVEKEGRSVVNFISASGLDEDLMVRQINNKSSKTTRFKFLNDLVELLPEL